MMMSGENEGQFFFFPTLIKTRPAPTTHSSSTQATAASTQNWSRTGPLAGRPSTLA